MCVCVCLCVCVMDEGVCICEQEFAENRAHRHYSASVLGVCF